MATLNGTSGNDSLNGSSGTDVFHLEEGGSDTATGLGGSNHYLMGAALDSGDRIVGGTSADTVYLEGDYSGGVTLAADTFKSVDALSFTGGFDYRLTLHEASVKPSALPFEVFGRDLGRKDALTLDARADTDGTWEIYLGVGQNTLMLGDGLNTVDLSRGGVGGKDRIYGGAGDDYIKAYGSLNAADRLDGGAGFDILEISSDFTAPVRLTGSMAGHFEEITVMRGIEDSIDLTVADSMVGKGKTLSFYCVGSADIAIDGSEETNGRLEISGDFGADTLTGGRKGDLIYGGDGEDVLTGGGGADRFASDLSDEADRFVYLSVEDSRKKTPDTIFGLDSSDRIDLSAIDADSVQNGDQAFDLVGAFTGDAGQAVLTFDGEDTRLSLDVDGDRKADAVIILDGDQSEFTGFVL